MGGCLINEAHLTSMERDSFSQRQVLVMAGMQPAVAAPGSEEHGPAVAASCSAHQPLRQQNGHNFTAQFKVEEGGRKQKGPARETDPTRLRQRQKQIDFGKNTLGYQLYLQQIPKHKREVVFGPLEKNPVTPRIEQICSKRSFDGQIRKWRRDLHFWDPEGGEEDAPVRQEEATAPGKRRLDTGGGAAEPAEPAEAASPKRRRQAPPALASPPLCKTGCERADSKSASPFDPCDVLGGGATAAEPAATPADLSASKHPPSQDTEDFGPEIYYD